MKQIKRMTAVAGMVMMTALFGVVAPTTAVAAPIHECEPGEWCIYEHTDFAGEQCIWSGNEDNYAGFVGRRFGRTCNDMMSSYVNMGGGTYACPRVFKHAGYVERMFTASPAWLPPNNIVPWVGISFTDRASSHSWGTC